MGNTKTISDHDAIRAHILKRLGMDEKPAQIIYKLEDLKKSEWSDRFEKLMRNRLVIGAFRYGLMGAKNKKPWDRLAYIRTKIERYEMTGNQEALVDIANLALLEFEEGDHEKKHFESLDNTEEHSPVKNSTRPVNVPISLFGLDDLIFDD